MINILLFQEQFEKDVWNQDDDTDQTEGLRIGEAAAWFARIYPNYPIYPNIIPKLYIYYDVAPFWMLISVDGSVKKCMHDPCMRNVSHNVCVFPCTSCEGGGPTDKEREEDRVKSAISICIQSRCLNLHDMIIKGWCGVSLARDIFRFPLKVQKMKRVQDGYFEYL